MVSGKFLQKNIQNGIFFFESGKGHAITTYNTEYSHIKIEYLYSSSKNWRTENTVF